MIYCFGDSHTTIFSEQPEFTVWGGSNLAYGFRDENHPVVVETERFLKEIPEQSSLMFMFGEIDCRVHIPKQFHKNERTMEEVAWDCVGRYIARIEGFVDRGYLVLLWGPHVMCKELYWQAEAADPETDCGARGTWEEIKEATRLFNKYSKVRCEGTPIRFATLFDWMEENVMYLDNRWYRDYNHLTQKCLPMIYRVMREAGFPL